MTKGTGFSSRTRGASVAALLSLVVVCAACGSTSPTATPPTTAPPISATTVAPPSGTGPAPTTAPGPNGTPTGPAVPTVSSQAPGPVPASYRSLYSTLQGQISSFAAVAGTPPANSSTMIASALEPADGNAMTPDVLLGNALANSTAMITSMKALGETAVTVQVNFPLLLASFPDSSTYTTFYQEVAQAVHAAGMTLIVEENPLFGNISSLSVGSFYASLNLTSFAADYQQQAQTIIDTMDPTYLAILNEPDTYTANLHNKAIDLNVAATGAQFVNLVLGGLDRKQTLVGAGSGTWTDPSYDQTLLSQTSIDFVDMHTYPVAAVDVSNMQGQVQEAEAAHKPIVMTECWLYKESTDGKIVDTPTSAPNEQKIGTYSFWEPLDSQFLTAMVDYAESNGFAVVSPFSTENLLAYQTWTPALDAESSTQVRSAFNQQVVTALRTDEISPVGDTVRKLAG